MCTIRRILVFGFPGIKSAEFDDAKMFFADAKLADHLANYDIILYTVGTFQHKYERESFSRIVLATAPPEAIRRENEVRLALEKGKIVCFIGSHGEDYVASRILESYDISFGDIHEGDLYSGLKIRRPEFKNFLDDVGSTAIRFSVNERSCIICTCEGYVVGFSKQIGRGLLMYLPCVWGSTEMDYVVDHLKKLVRGLVSYSTRVILEPPSYLRDFQFTNEKSTQGEVDRIKKDKLAPLEEKLKYYNKMKSILWLADNNLLDATNEFLKDFGFQTYIDEIHEEDLWIVDNGEKRIIVEVKGKSKNLTRQDISKLDEHREAREVPNLTGLLIANTFLVANSMESKDQPFPPNVIEKAVHTNVIITRTIDLCWIYDHLEKNGTQASEILLKIMIGQKGWLTLRDNEIKVVKS